jgi:hypothetical protein
MQIYGESSTCGRHEPVILQTTTCSQRPPPYRFAARGVGLASERSASTHEQSEKFHLDTTTPQSPHALSQFDPK